MVFWIWVEDTMFLSKFLLILIIFLNIWRFFWITYQRFLVQNVYSLDTIVTHDVYTTELEARLTGCIFDGIIWRRFFQPMAMGQVGAIFNFPLGKLNFFFGFINKCCCNRRFFLLIKFFVNKYIFYCLKLLRTWLYISLL